MEKKNLKRLNIQRTSSKAQNTFPLFFFSSPSALIHQIPHSWKLIDRQISNLASYLLSEGAENRCSQQHRRHRTTLALLTKINPLVSHLLVHIIAVTPVVGATSTPHLRLISLPRAFYISQLPRPSNIYPDSAASC